MSKTLLEIETLLGESIPRSSVQTRDGGGGRSLSYLQGHYVIDRLNRVFGPLGWATDIKALDAVHIGTIKDRYDKDIYTAHYIARVRLVVQAGEGIVTEHTDVGYGDGTDKSNPGKAHELAVKEAVTDAIKRCAKNLGMSMGLALYDKDQPNVAEEEAPAEPPKKEQAAKPPAAAAKSHDLALKTISAASKVLISLGKRTVDELKQEMRAKYKVDNKELLTHEQSAEFAEYLKEVSNGKA